MTSPNDTPILQDMLKDFLEDELEKRQRLKDPHQLREVVTWDRWIKDDYYSGAFANTMWDYWVDKIGEFEESGKPEIIITGSLGGGKSTGGLGHMGYYIYMNSCYRYPNRLYGLGDVSPLVFAYLSTTAGTAASTGFKDLRNYIDSSPYFREECPRRDVMSSLEFTKTTNILVMPGTGRGGGGSVISRNLYYAMLDEANFYKKATSSAMGDLEVTRATYKALTNRRRTRFARDKNSEDGLIDTSKSVLISSTDHDKSFTETRLKEARENDEPIHLIVTNPWLAQPEKFSKETFVVFTGNEFKQPQIIENKTEVVFLFSDNDADLGDELLVLDQKHPDVKSLLKELPFEQMSQFIEVPETFKKDFKRDCVSALKDIAGKSVKSSDKLYTNGPAWAMSSNKGAHMGLSHPFKTSCPSITAQNAKSLMEYFVNSKMFDEKTGLLKLFPDVPRFFHVDSSLTTCPTGLACCFQYGAKQDEVTGLLIPLIGFDFMLELEPPDTSGDEIDIIEVMKFILWLNGKGMKIGGVTYDMYNSGAPLQILRKYNIPAGRFSVDSNYHCVKDFCRDLTAGNVALYHYEPMRKSLFGLIDDRVKKKIVRPAGIWKDVFDAVIGAHACCVEKADRFFEGKAEDVLNNRLMINPSGPNPKMKELALDMAAMVAVGYESGGKKISKKTLGQIAEGVETYGDRKE